MSEIVSLLTVFSPHLSATTFRQFREIVFAVLAMTGGVTMRDISRWTSKGGSYRTLQRFYNTLIPWGTLCWAFFRAHLFDPSSVYLLAGDESIIAKSGDQTHGLSRFFASTYGKTILGLAFFAVSLVKGICEQLHISKPTLYAYLKHRGVEIGAYQRQKPKLKNTG